MVSVEKVDGQTSSSFLTNNVVSMHSTLKAENKYKIHFYPAGFPITVMKSFPFRIGISIKQLFKLFSILKSFQVFDSLKAPSNVLEYCVKE